MTTTPALSPLPYLLHRQRHPLSHLPSSHAKLCFSSSEVGSYHASSLLVASRPPTPGVLSRGIGLEGLSNVLAGLWGTGTSSTSLTENVHTLVVTKMGSRRAVELGACILVVLSFASE
ncbi:hypothetical protein CerSpe_174940 [Prunus speciosa]